LIEFKLFTSVTELPKASWNALTRHDIFLQTTYLEAASKALPKTIGMCYVAVFKNHQLVGVAVIQHVQLYLKDMFRHDDVTCIKEVVQNALSKVLKGHILVVGNLTHTGQHGIYFNTEMISEGEFLNVVFNAIKSLKIRIKKEYNRTIRLILFKDYFEDDIIHSEKHLFDTNKFHKLNVQPNMIMLTQKIWLKPQDYLDALTTKYRTRYKRARKKRNGIVTKELDLNALKESSKAIYNLYKHVSNNASFNTFILPENHFLSLKEHLQHNFKVFGYYLNNELIGFYSLILNNDSLETYFLGYDAEHQHSNQLYLNMLYDMAVYAIENNFKTVVYARTAMEIKSSVGAKPEAMFMYLKYTNPIVNALLKPIFSLMNPSQDWEQRHPFKKD
tara:strand:- start:3470 stop:4633 length:1164 start_codon:yes stop_codon:yes gene_type:complete